MTRAHAAPATGRERRSRNIVDRGREPVTIVMAGGSQAPRVEVASVT